MLPKSRPSATSLMVKSNSLRATKSSSSQACKRARGIDRDLGADHADLEIGIGRLQRADGLHVGGKRRRRGVQHHEIAVLDLRQDVGEAEPVRRRVDQLGALDQRGGLRQPGRIPERLDLAPVLIARAGSAIETLERRRLQKQGLHHGVRDLRSRLQDAFRHQLVVMSPPAHIAGDKARNKYGEGQ